MRHITLATAVALLVPSLLPAQQRLASHDPAAMREFRVEAAHTEVAFSIGFLGLPVKGRFDDVKGTIVYAAGAPAASSVTVAIATASINTGSKHRDEHLRSADFFDAARFPVILFRSIEISPAAGGGWMLKGALTMHGVTRPVTIPFRPVTSAPIEDPHGSTLVYFTGSTRLARKDFGILGGSKFNDWFDAARSATMADSVDVSLAVAGWDPDYARNHSVDPQLDRITRDGVDAVIARLRGLYRQNPDTLRDAEWEFDQVGRALLRRGRAADAVAITRFTTEIFPRSASAQTALARAYETAGARDSAVAAVARALAIDSLDTRALELRRRLGR